MKRRAPNGFTLLEMLLAISLMALITGAIMGGINLGRRTWETTRASEALDEVESAMRGVVGLLSRGYALQPDQTSTTPQSVFQGSEEDCRFVMLSEGGAQWGGLILTEIGGDAGDDGTDLAVWTHVFRTQEGFTPPRAAMRKTVFLRSVVSFQLAFFGPPEEGKPAVWSAKWENRTRLPALVSVKIGAKRLGRVIESEATVALRQ